MSLPSFFSSFRFRLLLLALVALVPLLAYLVYDVLKDMEMASTEAVRDITALLRTVRVEHEAVLAQGRQLGVVLAQIPAVQNGRSLECSALLRAAARPYPAFGQIAVADRDGEIHCSALAVARTASVADRPYFRQALERREFVVSEPVTGRISKRPVLILATPIVPQDEEAVGVVLVSLDIGWLTNALARFSFPEGSVIGLSSADGTVIARYPEPEKWLGQRIADTPFFRALSARGEAGSFEVEGLDGVKRLFVFSQPAKDAAQTVLWAGVPEAEVYGPVRASFAQRIALVALVLLGIAFVSRTIGKRALLDPMMALARAAERLGKGDWSARSGLEASSGEMGQLARTFDRMAAGIQRHEKDLAHVNRLLRTLSECNRAMLRSTGEADLLAQLCAQLVKTGGFQAAWAELEPATDLGRAALKRRQWSTQGDLAALPLRSNGELFGVLMVQGAGGLGAQELELLQESADDAGFGIATHRLRERHDEYVRYTAVHDHLTGLPNRAVLLDRMEQALVSARRGGRRAAVVALNLDRLKHVNESLGHDAGDAVLRAIAKKLPGQLRPGDTVARLGGDDFAILLTDLHRAEEAETVAQKLLAAATAPLEAAGTSLSLSASLGIALFPEDGEDAPALLGHADAAMHRAKSHGGRAIGFFTEELAARVHQRLALEQALGRALALEQLFVVYQPQIDARSGELIGAEALLRWQHPELGLVSPARFIPIAEETGLIVPIGDWVLRTACAQAARWRADGLPAIRMAVNLSARQFWHGELEARVRAALEESGLAPEQLELEITEGVVMRDADETARSLLALKALGLAVSIDDFGTGYSSLGYLRRFAIDRLKIDRSFIVRMESERQDAKLVASLIALAHSLDLKVLAEGVETAGQATLLKRLGCDELQGYFIARPLPADAFRTLLAK